MYAPRTCETPPGLEKLVSLAVDWSLLLPIIPAAGGNVLLAGRCCEESYMAMVPVMTNVETSNSPSLALSRYSEEDIAVCAAGVCMAKQTTPPRHTGIC